jgi:hypothetical protein
MSIAWFAAGAAVGFGVAFGLRALSRRRPSESELIAFADELDAIERGWDAAGVGVGYSIDYGTGATDVTIRVPNTAEDVTFRVERPGVTRRRREIEETLGLKPELPPSLRGDA